MQYGVADWSAVTIQASRINYWYCGFRSHSAFAKYFNTGRSHSFRVPSERTKQTCELEEQWRELMQKWELAIHYVAAPEKVEPADAELELIFNGLVKIWKDATGGYSVTSKRFSHPAYKVILRLGPEIVPLILKELRQRPDWWFEALEYLTNTNPASTATTFKAAVDAWLQWELDNRMF